MRACVRACVRVCVCVSIVSDKKTTKKRFEIFSPFITTLKVIKKPSDDVIGDVVPHRIDFTFTFFVEGNKIESSTSGLIV